MGCQLLLAVGFFCLFVCLIPSSFYHFRAKQIADQQSNSEVEEEHGEDNEVEEENGEGVESDKDTAGTMDECAQQSLTQVPGKL